MQNSGMAPPFKLGQKVRAQKRWPKIFFLANNWTKFERKPFLGIHLSLGRKTDLVLGWKIFILVFINLKFSEFPGSPFRKSCVRYRLLICNKFAIASLMHHSALYISALEIITALKMHYTGT